MKPRTKRMLVAVLIGWGFALGLVFITDTGPWEQPLGMVLVGLSVGSLSLICLQIPVVPAEVTRRRQ